MEHGVRPHKFASECWTPFRKSPRNEVRKFRPFSHRCGRSSAAVFISLLFAANWSISYFLPANQNLLSIFCRYISILYPDIHWYDDLDFGKQTFSFLYGSSFSSCPSPILFLSLSLSLIYVPLFSTVLRSTIKAINWSPELFYVSNAFYCEHLCQ